MHSRNKPQDNDQVSGHLPAHERILRSADLLTVLNISGPTLWRRVKDESFPQPISLGGRTVGWLQSEVNEWIKARAVVRGQSLAAKREGVQL